MGCAIDSPLCNSGTQPLDWFANPDPRHPLMVFNMYRLDPAGRFQQIGQSWVKHGFGAAQENACGFGCVAHPDNTRLGVGCSDTYSAGLNAFQGLLGPRREINPWTGGFTFAGSHLDGHAGGHNGVQHRLQLRDSDIDPAANPGATYIAECYIVAHDDVNHMNSVAREPVAVSGSPGGIRTFDISGSNTSVGPAIVSWTGAALTTIPANPTDDGRCILGVRVTEGGTGTWRYEYGLYNHDMNRRVGSFTLPVSSSVNISNVEFHAVPSDGEGYTNDPWTFTRGGDSMTWSTRPFAVNPNGNPLRWGTLYNFGFDACAPPMSTTATLGLHEPGDPSSVTGVTQGPSSATAVPAMTAHGVVIAALVMVGVAAWRTRRRELAA